MRFSSSCVRLRPVFVALSILPAISFALRRRAIERELRELHARLELLIAERDLLLFEIEPAALEVELLALALLAKQRDRILLTKLRLVLQEADLQQRLNDASIVLDGVVLDHLHQRVRALRGLAQPILRGLIAALRIPRDRRARDLDLMLREQRRANLVVREPLLEPSVDRLARLGREALDREMSAGVRHDQIATPTSSTSPFTRSCPFAVQRASKIFTFERSPSISRSSAYPFSWR
jgi:hypothetical protein